MDRDRCPGLCGDIIYQLLLDCGWRGWSRRLRDREGRSIGTKFGDASITTGVKTKFIHDERVDALDINVDTFEGVVTLNGSVPSKRVENRAIQIARSVKGVKRVRSKLRVISP